MLRSQCSAPAAGLAALTALTGLGSATAHAGVITFDPADGYALGSSLVASPDWAGNGALYSITSLGGGDGAAQSASTNQASFANNRFTPDAAFLGDTATDTAGRVYDFSFQLRNDAAGTDDSFGVAHRIRIGGTDSAPIVQFQVFDNGVLQYSDGSTSTSVNNVNGNRLDLDDTTGRFLDVVGTLDFNTGTWDLSVDGVSQGTGLAFLNTPSDFGQVTLQWGPSSSTPDYRQITIDDLAIAAIPEPASLVLAAAGGLLLFRRRSA